MKIRTSLLVPTLLAALLASCAATSDVRAVRVDAAPVAAEPAAHEGRLEGLRTPYGFGYRVGYGYAYRPWTW